MNALNRFEVLAVNDDRDFCECCGRQGLKRVVWVRDTETDVVKHFGTTCVLAPSKAFGVEADVKVAGALQISPRFALKSTRVATSTKERQ